MPQAELLARLRASRASICHIMRGDRRGAARPPCPDLRVVSNVAVGFNNIDVAAAPAAGSWSPTRPTS